MFFTYLFTFLLGVACLLQFAVDRAPDLEDSHDNKACRRLLIAGLFSLFAWMVSRCWGGYASNPLPLFGLTLIVLAEIGFCFNRLFPGLGMSIARTSFLKRNRGRGAAR